MTPLRTRNAYCSAHVCTPGMDEEKMNAERRAHPCAICKKKYSTEKSKIGKSAFRCEQVPKGTSTRGISSCIPLSLLRFGDKRRIRTERKPTKVSIGKNLFRVCFPCNK